MHADYHLNIHGTTWKVESYCFAPDCLLEQKKREKKGKRKRKKKNVLILLTPNDSLRCFDSIVTTYINLSNSRSRSLEPMLGLIVLQIIIFLQRKEKRAAPNNYSSYRYILNAYNCNRLERPNLLYINQTAAGHSSITSTGCYGCNLVRFAYHWSIPETVRGNR